MLQLYRLKQSLLDLSYYKDLRCFVINLLNNKTIILLYLAEYRLILADSAYGLVGYKVNLRSPDRRLL